VSLGSELAAAREAQGLSVDDVAARTRIRATLIRAIEDDDFAPCGGAVYARGHIRSIAHAIGVDPEPLLAEFDAPAVSVVPAAVPGGDLLDAEHKIARSTRPQRAHWGAVMATTLVVIIGLAVYSIVSNAGRNGGGGTAAGTSTPAVVTTTTTAPPPSTAAPTPTRTPTSSPTTAVRTTTPPPSDLALVPQHGVTVRLNVVTARSWFHVADSTGKTLFEGTLNAGQSKDFQDPSEIRMTIGAPKYVDLVVNGKDIGSVKTSGAVAHEVFKPAAAGNASHG
jgi:cytoskeletal protein RodZ